MKLSWLVPVVLGGGAAANLNIAGSAVADKVAGYENRIVLGKGITYQQDKNNNRRDHDGAPIQSRDANELPVDLDTLNLKPNRTNTNLHVQRGDSKPNQPADLPIVTFQATTRSSPDTEHPPRQQTRPSDLDHDPDPGEAARKRDETGNPASANRAIAGMSAGLVSVMLIFTVFL